jgi:hypothetical protein
LRLNSLWLKENIQAPTEYIGMMASVHIIVAVYVVQENGNDLLKVAPQQRKENVHYGLSWRK